MRTVNYRLALWIYGPSVGSLLSSPSVSEMRISGVSRHKGMRLRRHRRKNAFLVEAKTVSTPAIWRRVKSVASDLELVSGIARLPIA